MKVIYNPEFAGLVESVWEIGHKNCLMVGTAKKLKVPIDAHLSVIRGYLNAKFIIPRALGQEETMEVFGSVNGNLKKAIIRVDEPLDLSVCELWFKDPPIALLINSPGASVKRYQATSEKETVDIWIPRKEIEQVRLKMSKLGAKVNIPMEKRLDRADVINRELLTPEQKRVLLTLIESGFWDLPRRRVTLKSIAPRLGMSDTTLSYMIRDIAGKIFEEYVRSMRIKLR